MQVSELCGQTLGDDQYRLLARLGGGSFGTVYRAEERMNGAAVREVAIKIYKPEATDLGNVEGMLEDCALPARILASNAPLEQKQHFVPIYAFGKLETPAGRCAYVSMELVRGGETLESVISRCRHAKRFLQEADIVDYMKQFFTALALAHREGVLHRDIKGANVMVQRNIRGADGRAQNDLIRVMDFGMGAYTDQPEAALCTTMSIYAPENFEGRYTVASDLYQAGLLFLELYTGWSPFEEYYDGGADMERERKKRKEFVFRNGACFEGTNVSPRLDAILSRCLRYREEDRYPSANAVLEALSGASGADALRQAQLDNDLNAALRLAQEQLENPRLSDEQRLECLVACGEAFAGKGEHKKAIDVYQQALKLADERAVWFHRPSRYNELVESICIQYIKIGQRGTAELFRKKCKQV